MFGDINVYYIITVQMAIIHGMYSTSIFSAWILDIYYLLEPIYQLIFEYDVHYCL